MYFSQNVKHLSSSKGWKNVELAKRLDITPTQVGAYIKGKSYPKIDGLLAIGKLFDVNLDDLLLKDLSQESGRPFGATGEGTETADETLVRMNELLEQRLRMVEAALLRSDPDKAKEFGIE